MGNGQKHQVIDLFAGAGGLSLGFAEHGFETVAAVEFDADAAESFRAAHAHDRGGLKVHETDICGLDFTQFRDEASVIVGGPPCQPWSMGGLRRGHADPRDGFPQFARALYEAQPQAFVLENVAGLVRGSTKAAFEQIVGVLAGDRPLSVLLDDTVPDSAYLEYSVSFAVLHAADFGVPQTRQRLFAVGVQTERPFVWPEPTHGPGCQQPYASASSIVNVEGFGEPNPSIVTYARNPSLRPDPYHGLLFNGGGRPIDPAKPAPTLLASMGGNKTPWVDTHGIVPGYHKHLQNGGPPLEGEVEGARRITVAEAAALQTFPSDMSFAGARSSQYRQVGNAVPPRLAAAVAKQLQVALD